MDSLDWSKKFEVLSISRLQLESLGISHDQIASLTNEDMERIADILIAHLFDHEFEEEVVFTARLVLAEKRSAPEHIVLTDATEQAEGEQHGTLD